MVPGRLELGFPTPPPEFHVLCGNSSLNYKKVIMERIIVGIVSVAAGVTIIILRRKFVRYSIAFQNKTFGFHFGEKDIKAGDRAAPIIGLAFIILGTFTLSQG
jgi:hypothetical protein